ncbi:MAG: endonuclease III [Mogibacterium sp.]|nr:endonuclease III [Mogibacterium sp.]
MSRLKNNTTWNEKDVNRVLDLLKERYPEAGCALRHDSVFHLLIAVVLSAQTTDVSVNKVTPELFRRYPDPASLAAANPADVQEIIRQIGLYKSKASNIIRLSEALVRDYNCEVPGDHAQLTKLPGVGRKTANVVLAEGFGEQRIAVDTHVFRVSNRIGLAASDDVVHTEEMLMEVLPNDRWTEAHHLLIFHGRNLCKARKPDCEACPISGFCKYCVEKSTVQNGPKE